MLLIAFILTQFCHVTFFIGRIFKERKMVRELLVLNSFLCLQVPFSRNRLFERQSMVSSVTLDRPLNLNLEPSLSEVF